MKAQNLKQELEKTKTFYLDISENQENTNIKNKLQQTEEEKIVLWQPLQSLQETREKQESNISKPDHSQTQNETLQENLQEKEENEASVTPQKTIQR